MRILLDTNVVLDFVVRRQPFFAEANEIFARLANGEFDGFVSSITPINIFYIARKQYGNEPTKQAIANLLLSVKVCSVDEKIIKSALTSAIKDYEDAVQHECALAENLDAIVTRNTKDYAKSSVKIYAPTEFLRIL
ncbi:MAG: PIN domain-containing protein [Pyrinomonadaceae bacterium]